MLLKNRPGALLAQPRGGSSDTARRFVLDGRLLEVLLQVSLLCEGTDGSGNLVTARMRVDAFLALLRSRYGLYIDRIPDGDGFTGAHLDDQAALRANSAAFLHRLREIGYYQDMSDAYLTHRHPQVRHRRHCTDGSQHLIYHPARNDRPSRDHRQGSAGGPRRRSRSPAGQARRRARRRALHAGY